jgi:hypothetical protein
MPPAYRHRPFEGVPWRPATNVSLLRAPSAFIPLLMSSAAIVLLASQLILSAPGGFVREADEGAAAHIWQILMAGQLPFIAFFAVKWLPRVPRSALLVLAMHLFAGLAAAAPVFLLGL